MIQDFQSRIPPQMTLSYRGKQLLIAHELLQLHCALNSQITHPKLRIGWSTSQQVICSPVTLWYFSTLASLGAYVPLIVGLGSRLSSVSYISWGLSITKIIILSFRDMDLNLLRQIDHSHYGLSKLLSWWKPRSTVHRGLRGALAVEKWTFLQPALSERNPHKTSRWW